MDFSKFSNDAFDVKEWVNNCFPKDANINVEAHASNLVMKLQLFIQEVNKSLEETSQLALNNMPRILREVEAIKTEAQLLQRQMQLVKDDIRKVEECTAMSMQTLVEIDTVKGRMQDAANALQEADNWSTLSSEVTLIFASENVPKIAEKLVGMQKSLHVLQDVQDYADRRHLLEQLKNKLEACLSTKLVATFNNHHLDDAKYYVHIFSELERLSQLQTYYINCHKSSVLSTWKEIRDDPNKSITSWLPKFFDHLLVLWHREIAWCGQVFPEPVQALSSLMSQIINNLHPSMEDCVGEAVAHSPNALDLLIQLQQVTSRFVAGLETAVRTFQGAATMPMSGAAVQLISDVRAPYTPYLMQYSQLQQSVLMDGLEAMNMSFEDLADAAEVMIESVDNAFRLAEEAKVSCIKFTQGYGATGLLHSLQIFFSAYFGKLDSVLMDSRKLCGVDRKESDTDNGDSVDQWSGFQNAFKIIEMCGLLLGKMVDFRKLLTTELTSWLERICKGQSDSTAHMNYLKLARSADWDGLMELHERLATYDAQAVLPVCGDLVERLNEHAHKFAFDVVFVRLKRVLCRIPSMQDWSSIKEEAIGGELPTFSPSPLGYITQVGDCLLTLPQQLEPFFVQENEALMRALDAGKVPFTDIQGGDSSRLHRDVLWVNGLACGASTVFVENVLKIRQLTPHASRQLSADIEYFCNVLAALEVPASDDLAIIKQLVEVEAERFQEKVDDLNVDASIVAALSKMKCIGL